MRPEFWSEGDGLVSMPDSQQAHLDRRMIRHLLSRYTKEELRHLMDEESGMSLSHNEGAFKLGGARSSIKSEDAPNAFDSTSNSNCTFSDTSSTNGSTTSTVSARTAKLLNRKSQSIETSRTSTDDAYWEGEDSVTSANTQKQKGTFSCGFCSEEGIQKTCTRKNDLKRHIEDFHHTNAQWFCRHRGCHMVFDWQTAYKAHLKHTHGGSRMSLDDAKVDICPQTVFACGFENCLQVFEASDDVDAASTFKEYVSHVVKHFDEGTNGGQWSYSSRMRNLLRQSGVLTAWTNSTWADVDHARLTWNPHSSCVLRKRLETRHIGDLQLLIHYAVVLGSDNTAMQVLREDFVTPIKNQCQLAATGHSAGSQGPVQASVSPPTGCEAFNFNVPRGADPALLAYYPSPGNAYRPGVPVRSARGSLGDSHAIGAAIGVSTASSATPGFGFQQTPVTSESLFSSENLSLGQQRYTMAVQGTASMGEDLRHLRSMNAVSPEPDLEMNDGHMADSGYIHQYQHGFSHSFGSSSGLHSPTLTDGCGVAHSDTGMEHQGQYVTY